jgi:hypothetical protein
LYIAATIERCGDDGVNFSSFYIASCVGSEGSFGQTQLGWKLSSAETLHVLSLVGLMVEIERKHHGEYDGLPNVGMYTWSIDGVPADCKVLKYIEFVESEPFLGQEFAYSPAQHVQASLDIGQLCKLHRQSILVGS